MVGQPADPGQHFHRRHVEVRPFPPPGSDEPIDLVGGVLRHSANLRRHRPGIIRKVSVSHGDQLREAERALDQAEWDKARRGFEAVLETSESAPAYEGLGLALWFLGRVDEGIAARQRAFELYARERQCSDAARVAVWVPTSTRSRAAMSAARGWVARAERAVLTEVDTCDGHGWVAVERARTAPRSPTRSAMRGRRWRSPATRTTASSRSSP